MKKDKNYLNEVWYNKIFYDYILRQYYSLNSINNYKRSENKIDISGQWATNWGTMKLVQEGNKVVGTYEWDNGKIEGILEGYNFKGTWSEPPTYKCPDLKGGLDFKFSVTGQSFEGSWSYCDLKEAGVWMGTKITQPEVNSVNGSWTIDNGLLLLEQGNGKIDGTYIEGLNENSIRLNGDIVKNDSINKFVVDGEWIKAPTYDCPENKGKVYMEFDIPINNTKLYLLDCDGNIDKNKVFEGSRIAGPKPLNVAGIWNTNVGKMEFTQNEGMVIGSYRQGKANIEGRILGNVLIGKWYEAGNYSCPYDSGDVQLIFATNATVFEGYWAYCNEKFSGNKKWEGVRVN
ncbi:hypothetical protein [Faecalimicrobium dakarense]|uniref:hypothetical protein n=1 Tax=Faecalimicrobium dakarense TaxID=1301100 RepID=UPI0004B30CF3|nr:hypothetical protein [[Clostridium] dakarense]